MRYVYKKLADVFPPHCSIDTMLNQYLCGQNVDFLILSFFI